MTHPLPRGGQRLSQPTARAAVHTYLGVRFRIESIPRGRLFSGRYTLLEDGYPRDDRSGDISPSPAAHNVWATEAEALAHAMEGARHAIEGITPYGAGAPSGP